MPLLDKDAETAAGWVESGIQPGAAMDGFMKRVVEQTQTDVRGMAGLVPSLEGLEPPAELVKTPKLALAVSVASYRPEGSPWVMWVVLWVALSPAGADCGGGGGGRERDGGGGGVGCGVVSCCRRRAGARHRPAPSAPKSGPYFPTRTKRSVIRSLSPMATYLSLSCSPRRSVGGSVHTPSG
jgi:hypothetical protein